MSMAQSSAPRAEVYLSSNVDLDVRLKVTEHTPKYSDPLSVLNTKYNDDASAENRALRVSFIRSRQSQVIGLHGRLPTVGLCSELVLKKHRTASRLMYSSNSQTLGTHPLIFEAISLQAKLIVLGSFWFVCHLLQGHLNDDGKAELSLTFQLFAEGE